MGRGRGCLPGKTEKHAAPSVGGEVCPLSARMGPVAHSKTGQVTSQHNRTGHITVLYTAKQDRSHQCCTQHRSHHSVAHSKTGQVTEHKVAHSTTGQVTAQRCTQQNRTGHNTVRHSTTGHSWHTIICSTGHKTLSHQHNRTGHSTMLHTAKWDRSQHC